MSHATTWKGPVIAGTDAYSWGSNARAASYAESLEERYVRPRRLVEMLEELRRFYRLGYAEKCDVIAQAA